MLPSSNVDDLMLDPDILEDVASGRYHLWEVDHVDAGFALLTGKKPAEIEKLVTKALEDYERKDEDEKNDDDKNASDSAAKNDATSA